MTIARSFIAIAAFGFICTTSHAAVDFHWAIIGNPGNLGDAQEANDGTTGYGGVPDLYRISKYEVTNSQYTDFLNAVDPMGTNVHLGGDDPFLYDSRMSLSAVGGIDFDIGAANGSKYHPKVGRDDNPVVFVSFFDAMRFTNWLQNGQGRGSTESGVYTIENGHNEARNPRATYFIPSEDEWYKAAYHKNDGVTPNYWDYPTSTDAVPFSDQPPGSDAPSRSNVANFHRNDEMANGYNDGFAVDGSNEFDALQNYLTDVGAYSESPSPYGTFDQGGNVWEWNEAVDGSYRILRGASWYLGRRNDMSTSFRNVQVPSWQDEYTGFRVASSVPEPGGLGLAGFIGVLVAGHSRRRRHSV